MTFSEHYIAAILSLTACPVPKVCIKRLQVSLLPGLGMGSWSFGEILNIFGNKADVQTKIRCYLTLILIDVKCLKTALIY